MKDKQRLVRFIADDGNDAQGNPDIDPTNPVTIQTNSCFLDLYKTYYSRQACVVFFVIIC